jgi:hypothetical protein
MTRFTILLLSTLFMTEVAYAQNRMFCPSGSNEECPAGYRCQITWSTGSFYCTPLNPHQPPPEPTPPAEESECRDPWVC